MIKIYSAYDLWPIDGKLGSETPKENINEDHVIYLSDAREIFNLLKMSVGFVENHAEFYPQKDSRAYAKEVLEKIDKIINENT